MAEVTVRRSRAGYLPIAEYGLIGDCRSAALVGSDGSIDWLCLPRFDDASVFGRILDARCGGFWQIRPAGRHTVRQAYRDNSNVLRTTFSTATGVAVLIDFMPITEERIAEHARPHGAPRLVRFISCVSGTVELENVIDPAPDYGRARVRFQGNGDHFHGDGDRFHYCVQSTVPLRSRRTLFTLTAGESAAFGLRAGRTGRCSAQRWNVGVATALLRATQEFWWRWIDQCTYSGPYQQLVRRSALALKLMTYSPTGAIIAAPTTSLPEKIGSYHNYDYRFTWLRDAAFILYAFFQLGFADEATDFFGWLKRIGLDARRDVPNLYTLDGSDDIPEFTLGHLSGYRGSHPVRVGNAAVDQLQLDVYGELIDAAYVWTQHGGRITRETWRDLHAIVDLAVARWEEPDRSIWEPRGGDLHFTYSKLMCWVAVDRGLRLATRFHLPHRAAVWRQTRERIRRTLLDSGFNAKLGAFTQTLGGDTLDAAMLRMSQARFLHQHDPRLTGTVQAIRAGLSDGGGVLVRRFRRAGDDMGGRSREGAFLLCSFWLADALAHAGDLEAAEIMFERLLAVASPLGLFAEEADMVTAEHLGNYPQAFTHLALVGAAVNIERVRDRTLGLHPMRGAGVGRGQR